MIFEDWNMDIETFKQIEDFIEAGKYRARVFTTSGKEFKYIPTQVQNNQVIIFCYEERSIYIPLSSVDYIELYR